MKIKVLAISCSLLLFVPSVMFIAASIDGLNEFCFKCSRPLILTLWGPIGNLLFGSFLFFTNKFVLRHKSIFKALLILSVCDAIFLAYGILAPISYISPHANASQVQSFNNAKSKLEIGREMGSEDENGTFYYARTFQGFSILNIIMLVISALPTLNIILHRRWALIGTPEITRNQSHYDDQVLR